MNKVISYKLRKLPNTKETAGAKSCLESSASVIPFVR